ncbi:hypothetical protein JOC77_002968 [Peribacillus deserti]|uniref:Uncharacterized protein n=1 Tax=Peribacillus deserti TaxID=673318 RepID=A0ABS2QK20_9BACI|nr:hypothetical protein [Peribacillus deserti]MBM7693528.1 hypothetical protein [Peribacillus deserti]
MDIQRCEFLSVIFFSFAEINLSGENPPGGETWQQLNVQLGGGVIINLGGYDWLSKSLAPRKWYVQIA